MGGLINSGQRKMTVKRLFQGLNAFLTDESVVIADAGDALFGAVDLVLGCDAYFLSPAYYASLGFAVPASVGGDMESSFLNAAASVEEWWARPMGGSQ